jgi:hypothetical protein
MRLTLSAVAFVMIWSPLAAQVSAPPTAPDLPKQVRKAIDDQIDKQDKESPFKNWSVATIDAQRAPCWRDAAAPPAVLQGDFNGDGRGDYAVLIQGAERAQLVAVFDRIPDPMVVDIDTAPPADGYLALQKKGQPYVDPDNHLKEFFTNDTVIVQRCGQPRDAYFWNGFAFRKIAMTEDN